MGWCDGTNNYNISFSVAVRPWGYRHENIDTWFSRYFYKNANSALTSAGGRTSNIEVMATTTYRSYAQTEHIAPRYLSTVRTVALYKTLM